jgi:hypothetical protein
MAQVAGALSQLTLIRSIALAAKNVREKREFGGG